MGYMINTKKDSRAQRKAQTEWADNDHLPGPKFRFVILSVMIFTRMRETIDQTNERNCSIPEQTRFWAILCFRCRWIFCCLEHPCGNGNNCLRAFIHLSCWTYWYTCSSWENVPRFFITSTGIDLACAGVSISLCLLKNKIKGTQSP